MGNSLRKPRVIANNFRHPNAPVNDSTRPAPFVRLAPAPSSRRLRKWFRAFSLLFRVATLAALSLIAATGFWFLHDARTGDMSYAPPSLAALAGVLDAPRHGEGMALDTQRSPNLSSRVSIGSPVAETANDQASMEPVSSAGIVLSAPPPESELVPAETSPSKTALSKTAKREGSLSPAKGSASKTSSDKLTADKVAADKVTADKKSFDAGRSDGLHGSKQVSSQTGPIDQLKSSEAKASAAEAAPAPVVKSSPVVAAPKSDAKTAVPKTQNVQAAAASSPSAAPDVAVRGEAPAAFDITGTLTTAKAKLNEGELDASLKLYARVLQEDPKNRPALKGKAFILGQTGHVDEAASIDRQLLKLDPHDGDTRSALSGLLAQSSSSDAAGQLSEMLSEDPEDAGAQAALSQVLARQGDLTGAIRHQDLAMQNAPANIMYRFDLALLYDRVGDKDQALALYQQVLSAENSGAASLAPSVLASVRQRADSLETAPAVPQAAEIQGN